MRNLLLVFAVVVILGGCLDVGPETTGSGQGSADYNTAIAIVNSLVYLYNTNLVGKPSGVQNQIGLPCPLGGTVDITGSTTVSNVMVLDLTYGMTSCGIIDSDFTMTYSGDITEVGSFDSNAGNISRQFTSSQLSFSGTAYGSAVGGSCLVAIVWNYDDISGLICGRGF